MNNYVRTRNESCSRYEKKTIFVSRETFSVIFKRGFSVEYKSYKINKKYVPT